MDRTTWDDRTTIESQLATELNQIEPNPIGANGQAGTKASPDAVPDSEMNQCSVSDLYQLAYQRVEDELDILRSEMRQLREKHRAVESVLERRILQKEALRRKIIASATGNPDPI